MKALILLVEDDLSLGETLISILEKNNFKVEWSQNLKMARDSLNKNKFDLVILDVGLPDGSGFDFSKEIVSIPFIFLTALNDANDRLTGYEAGAMDYIPKPFHMKELLIKIDRILNFTKKENVLIFDEFKINLDSMTIKNSQQECIQPSAKDFKVLTYLIQNSPKVISRDELLDNIWGKDNFPSTRTVDNSILRLRQIFSDKDDLCIKSIRGVGYQWVKPVKKD